MKKIIIGMLLFLLCLFMIKGYMLIHKKIYLESVDIKSNDFYDKLLKEEPIQVDLKDSEINKYSVNELEIKPIKKYKIVARVLKIKNYNGENSEVVPVDFVLGWNKMSEKSILEENKIKISQSNRFYFWSIPNFDKISRNEIEKNSANTHIGGIDKNVEKQLEDINEGDLVYLEGYLVNILNTENKKYFNTSVSRDDTGAGACEILIVETVKILNFSI